MEQPTEQPFSVGQIEQPVCILEQPNQPMGKQRRSEVSRETRETSRDINNMAAPWSHQVFDRLSKNLDSYEKHCDLMNKISDRVNQLSTQVPKLTRKRPLSSERTDTNTKKQRVQLPLVPNFDGDDFSASDDNIQQQNNQSKSLDAIIDSSEEDEALEEGEVSGEDMLADLQAAFQQTAETGPNIDQKIADVLNDGLRKPPSDETIKVLKDKHKRPDNINNLQIPRSDKTVWSALHAQTRSQNAATQKMLGMFGYAIVPIIKQMEIFCKHKKQPKDLPTKELRKLAQESYQLFCAAVSATNQKRRELFKRDLDTKYHKICDREYPMLATELFGDKLDNDLKELEEAKRMKLKKSFKPSSNYEKRSTNYGEKFLKAYGRDQNQYFHKGLSQNHRPQNQAKKPFKSRMEGMRKEKR